MKAFPVIYARDIPLTMQFYERLGFTKTYQFPPEGEPGYVSMRRGDSQIGITEVDSPRTLIGVEVGTAPKIELFVYVEDVDGTVTVLRDGGVSILREPQDMPWGERLAYVSDPEGNPVALAQEPG